ncbi:interleukin-12 receptor subunit beta-1 isoform X1 [Vombatus ursinus]|uniref:interleukin-12 receptor subunit beta-1 isoform X1 n=1 Tax=Vombatus ursinus TaxID=29139 RepID=UPI000FFCF89D|nr:interleukin-12 receptor subunit beta-1 isoform X1 [Vombatus ursinus]
MPWLLLLILAGLARRGGTCKNGECCFEELPFWERGSGLAEGPRDLLCYRIFPKGFKCSWQYDGDPTHVTHFLRCCLRNGNCCYLEAGTANQVWFTDQAKVPILQNVTFWVESRVGNRTAVSPEITLALYGAFKFDPPNGEMTISKLHGQLMIKWEIPEKQEDAIAEYRYRTWNGTWEQGDCGAQMNSDFETCSLHLEAPVAYEIQLRRHKRASPTGQWSDWSKSICIPAEIPEVNYTVGKLDNDGKRDLILDWEQPRPVKLPPNCVEKVNFSLVLRMLSCPCKQKFEKKVKLEKVIRVSGAEYEVIIQTQGTIGPQLNRTFRIPADVNSGFIQDAKFLNISTSEDNVTMQWLSLQRKVKRYCIEWYPYLTNWTNITCSLKSVGKEKNNRKVTYSWDKAFGIMDPGKCYRINIYASDKPQNPHSWVTVFSVHHFSGDVLKAGPSYFTVRRTIAHEVTLEWNPSPLSKCPGVLEKYVIYCWNEANNKTILHYVKASALGYTIGNLSEGTFYTIQIRGDTATTSGAWSQPLRFKLDDKVDQPFPFFLLCVMIFAAVVLMAGTVYFVMKRVKSFLCPPLPNPSTSSATKFLAEDMKLVRPWVGSSDTVKDAGLRDLLIVEVSSPKVEPEVGSEVRLLHLEEPKGIPDIKERQTGGENDPPLDLELPSGYNRQNHVEVAGEDGSQDTRHLCGQDGCDRENMVPLFVSPEAEVPGRVLTLSLLSVLRPSESSGNLNLNLHEE